MKRMYMIILTLLLCISFSHAQSFELSASTLQGLGYNAVWDIYPGGIEISAAYRTSDVVFDYAFGLKARTVQWGSQLSIASEMIYPIKNALALGLEVQNGVALFHDSPLYVVSFGLNASYRLFEFRKSTLLINTGIRYTHCPAYSNYGTIDRIIEMPIGIMWSFNKVK